MSKTSDQVRRDFKASDDIRDAGLGNPAGIVRYDDIAYGDDSKWQMLDVYRPKADDGKKLPVIVSIHGGGWVYGDKERYQYYCMDLAMRGFAVINFTYRLAPEYKFPAAVEDTNSVFEWMFANADKYDLDVKNVFAVGDSAGANILGLYSAICTNPEYAGEYSFSPPKGFVPTAIALNCGAYEIQIDGDPEDLTVKLMADLLPEKGSEKEMRMINVIKHITKDFPPTFFMTCTGDFLKWQAPLLAAKLAECNVPYVNRCYVNPEKELPHVFHCDMKSEDAKLCNDEECEFFRKNIKAI